MKKAHPVEVDDEVTVRVVVTIDWEWELIWGQHVSDQKEKNCLVSSFFSIKGLLTLRDLIWNSDDHALPTSQVTHLAVNPLLWDLGWKVGNVAVGLNSEYVKRKHP